MMDYGKTKTISNEIRCFDWIKLIDWYRLISIDSRIPTDTMIWSINHNPLEQKHCRRTWVKDWGSKLQILWDSAHTLIHTLNDLCHLFWASIINKICFHIIRDISLKALMFNWFTQVILSFLCLSFGNYSSYCFSFQVM